MMSPMCQGRGLAVFFRADGVSWNRHLGKVVEEVVGKHLDGCHRHEGQKRAGADHAEHVAKVGAGTHADVFEDVYENFAPLDDAFLAAP